MITAEQVKDVEQLRTTIHGLVGKGIADEYLLATYNGILRRLDSRLPNIQSRATGKSLKDESRVLVKQQRANMGRKNAGTATPSSPSGKKAS